jgi:hypothetical protein
MDGFRLKMLEGDHLLESKGELIRTSDDITTADGESIFVDGPIKFMESVIVQHIEAGHLANGAKEGVDYWIVDSSERPSDHDCSLKCEFLEAWEWDSGVRVNMPKARGIHMDKIRVVRNAELAAKDISFMRAVEAGDASTQSTIATEKQVLRDIPQTFDLTTDNDTPEELKAKWPAELPARE